MDPKTIKKVVKELAETKELDQDKANTVILKYTDRSQIGVTKNTKYLFRPFIVKFITKVPKKDIEDTFKYVNEVYNKIGYKDSTLDSIISKDIRNQFKDTEYYTLSKKLIKISYEAKGNLIKTQKKNLALKHEEKIRFSSNEIMTLIRRLNSSDDVNDNLIALMLATGSRPIELLVKSGFQMVESSDGMTVIKQSDLAKKGKATGTFSVKPLLVLTYKEFEDTFEKVRNHFESEKGSLTDRRGELNKNVLVKSNDIMKKLFDNSDGITLYSCRGIYVVLSYYLYAKSGLHGRDPTLSLWGSKCLGHSENDLTQQLNYTKFDLTDNEKPIEDVKKDVAVLTERVDSVEEKVAEEDLPYPKLITSKQGIKNAQYNVIKNEYEKNKISQTAMETLMKGKIPRSIVRSWYLENKMKRLEDLANGK